MKKDVIEFLQIFVVSRNTEILIDKAFGWECTWRTFWKDQ